MVTVIVIVIVHLWKIELSRVTNFFSVFSPRFRFYLILREFTFISLQGFCSQAVS